MKRCLKITEKVSLFNENAKNGQREGRNQKKEEKQVLLSGQRRQERNQNTNKVVNLEIYRLN